MVFSAAGTMSSYTPEQFMDWSMRIAAERAWDLFNHMASRELYRKAEDRYQHLRRNDPPLPLMSSTVFGAPVVNRQRELKAQAYYDVTMPEGGNLSRFQELIAEVPARREERHQDSINRMLKKRAQEVNPPNMRHTPKHDTKKDRSKKRR